MNKIKVVLFEEVGEIEFYEKDVLYYKHKNKLSEIMFRTGQKVRVDRDHLHDKRYPFRLDNRNET